MIILKNMYMYDAAMLLVAVGCRVGGKGFVLGAYFVYTTHVQVQSIYFFLTTIRDTINLGCLNFTHDKTNTSKYIAHTYSLSGK